MPIFQVTSRAVQPVSPPGKHTSHTRHQWHAIARRLLIGGLIIAALATILGRFGLSTLFFILLPVIVTLIRTPFHRYNRNTFLLTAALALIYFGGVTWWELLTHGPGTSELIVVTTTLALAVLFDPVRVWAQTRIEQRFNLRNREAIKAIEAFTSTLREEIDLNQVRERFLDVIQKTMQPQSVSLWVRTSVQDDMPGSSAQAEWKNNSQQIQPEERIQEEQEPTREPPAGTEPSEVNVADSDPLIDYALHHPGTIMVERLQLASPVLQTLNTDGIEIVLPLASQGELIGLLTLGPRLNEQAYAREDRNLLSTLAAQVAPALRVAQMVRLQQEHERIEQELRTAQQIQRTFLPKDVPQLPGWQLIPYYQPAREVGGDFYDFLPFEDGRLGLVIGDVTGKGIPAALVMTATRTMLRTTAQEKTSPSDVLARVNDLLCTDIPPGMFVTCFYALLNPKSGQLHYANAGHELPFRRHDRSASELWAAGMPLGLMPDSCYEEHEATIAPGECLLFYSDGLVEAHNSNREMFGFPRLKTLLTEHSDGASLIDFLLSQLQHFTGQGWQQEDDVTLVTLQRTPESLTLNEQQANPHLLLKSTLPGASSSTTRD